jgi:hypothetical protein
LIPHSAGILGGGNFRGPGEAKPLDQFVVLPFSDPAKA